LEMADVFVGVSAPGIFKPQFLGLMKKRPIIFAMANPIPEIMPVEAKKNGAFIVGTGRSDFPNQINNLLVFPGLFKGLLKNKIRIVTDEIKIAVAETIANFLPSSQLKTSKILPSVLDKGIAEAISQRLTKFKKQGTRSKVADLLRNNSL